MQHGYARAEKSISLHTFTYAHTQSELEVVQR